MSRFKMDTQTGPTAAKSMAFVGGRQKLVHQAIILKKAWIVCIAWKGAGPPRGPVKQKDLLIPNYAAWTRKELQQHVENLEGDFKHTLNDIIPSATGRQRCKAAAWLGGAYDRWVPNWSKPFTLCTVQQFESEVAPLLIRSQLDLPPYAELLMQGFLGLAFRHPEYMLSRDLQLLFNLAHDAEQLNRSLGPKNLKQWAPAAGENGLALNRATIQTCFNLLESFTSGLARAFLMENVNTEAEMRKRLLDQNKPLRSRIALVPNTISAGAVLDVNNPPVSRLFGEIKQRRDAIVHCEPGPQASDRAGYVKETAFHDASWEVAQEAMKLTLEIIKTAWKAVHGKDRPSWLPELGADGRFPTRDLRLNPPHLG